MVLYTWTIKAQAVVYFRQSVDVCTLHKVFEVLHQYYMCMCRFNGTNWCLAMNGVIAQWEPLHWHHNERDGVSYRRRLVSLFSRVFWVTSKKTPKPALLAIYKWNRPVSVGFPSQRANTAETVSIWWLNLKLQSSIHCVFLVMARSLWYPILQALAAEGPIHQRWDHLASLPRYRNEVGTNLDRCGVDGIV